MKKFPILAALVLAVACSREEQFATLSFGLREVEEHSITKSYVEDCASYTYAHSNTSGSVAGSGIKLRFFGWDNDYELAFTAKPVSYDTSEDTRFVFGGTGVKATNGKFYVLHPEAVTTEEGGFTFNIADWTEGAL